jgi:ATP-dependent protease HslVU (ClpYQ) ATPase subunit
VLERLIEDISFEAPDKVAAAAATAESAPSNQKPGELPEESSTASGETDAASEQSVRRGTKPVGGNAQELVEVHMLHYEHVIDKQQVREKLQSLLKQDDLSKYIL